MAGIPCTPECHAKLVGRFCVECGQHLGAPREPGELKAMLARLKAATPPAESRYYMTWMLVYFTIANTVKWALGEVTDESLLKLLDFPYRGEERP